MYSVCQQSGRTQQWPQDWKSQFSFQSQRRAMPKNVKATAQLHLFSMLVRLCSKFFKLGFSSTWTENFQMYKLRKGRGTRGQISNLHWIMEKAREFQKKSTSASLTMLWPWTMWITTNCGKLKRWKYQTTLPVSWVTCTQVKKQQLEPDMERRTGSKLGKE